MERHWVSGTTILAAWHVTFVRQASGQLVRMAGFLTAEVASDGRVEPIPRVDGLRSRRQGIGKEDRWPETNHSTSSATSTSRSCATPSTRSAARSGTRFDFKGVTVDLSQAKDELILITDDEHRAAAVKDLIESKAIRRSLSLKIFDWGKVEEAGGNKVRQRIGLRRGLSDENAKKITKLIRDEFPKVKSQIQGDAVRVSGKSRDDLQRVMARLRELDLAVPLQFENYR